MLPPSAIHQPIDLPLERPQHDLASRVAHILVPAVEGLEDLGKVRHEVVVFPSIVILDGVDIDGDVSPLILGLVRCGAELELALNSRKFMLSLTVTENIGCDVRPLFVRAKCFITDAVDAPFTLWLTTSAISSHLSYFGLLKLRGTRSNFLVSKSSSEVERAVQNRSRKPKLAG